MVKIWIPGFSLWKAGSCFIIKYIFGMEVEKWFDIISQLVFLNLRRLGKMIITMWIRRNWSVLWWRQNLRRSHFLQDLACLERHLSWVCWLLSLIFAEIAKPCLKVWRLLKIKTCVNCGWINSLWFFLALKMQVGNPLKMHMGYYNLLFHSYM